MMNKLFFKYCPIILIALLFGCTKWSTTEDLSHVSQLPVFTLEGGEFMSFNKAETGFFEDPGVTATSNGVKCSVQSYQSVDTIKFSKVGVYFVYYLATNSDGLSNTTQRVVVVRDIDVANNDLSGKYYGTYWTLMQMKVRKIDPNGYYKVEEVLGYPGSEMPGKFVDMGDNNLVLVNGEGDFGRYKSSEGTYTRSTLNWTISLIDEPYKGVEVPVTWHKEE